MTDLATPSTADENIGDKVVVDPAETDAVVDELALSEAVIDDALVTEAAVDETLVTETVAAETLVDAAVADEASTADGAGTPPLVWGPPAEPAPRRSWRKALWIGIPVAVVVGAAWYFGTTLIAPGMVVGNVAVGGMTVDAAAAKIDAAVAGTTLTLSADGEEGRVSGADLGAAVDAKALAQRALQSHPLWNVTNWYPESGSSLRPTIDSELASAALRSALPGVYVAPVNAALAYDPTTLTFVATDGADGVAVARTEVRGALVAALNDAAPVTAVDVHPAPLAPELPTLAAINRAAVLNSVLDTAGFYVGTERVVPIDRATAASWITVEPDAAAGLFRFKVDASALPALVETLPALVDRAAVDTKVVVNSAGATLATIAEGAVGRAMGSTKGIADAFAEQLNSGSGAYELAVTETPFAVATLHRRIEVDISEQRTYLFENDQVVQSWAVSTGLPGHDTNQGKFKIYAHVRIQDMGSEAAGYLTKNVPWVSYFNGDEAFHGAYWHNNFGHRMSHGCVNMRLPEAQYVYDWAPIGTEVWVHG
mgnify:FL=1